MTSPDVTEVMEIESDVSDSASSSSGTEDLLSEPEIREDPDLGSVPLPAISSESEDQLVARNWKSRIVHWFNTVSFEHLPDPEAARALLEGETAACGRKFSAVFGVVRIPEKFVFKCKLCFKAVHQSHQQFLRKRNIEHRALCAVDN